MTPVAETQATSICIGGLTATLHSSDATFQALVRERYAGFISEPDPFGYDFDVDVIPIPDEARDEDVRVWREGPHWKLVRGDFHAEWEPALRRGRIRQSANPYSVDSVLRIVHTLALAKEGGFLIHAASAIRNGKAFIFSGVSTAGKTTISRLAPPDATLLSDEMSCVRRTSSGYVAHGTPFAGELAKSGENVAAPLAVVYLLAKGPENRIDDVTPIEATRAVLRNILFFAEDQALVDAVFESVCEFVEHVPVRRLTFVPDARVWELIV